MEIVASLVIGMYKHNVTIKQMRRLKRFNTFLFFSCAQK
jgi:hypothetical protein